METWTWVNIGSGNGLLPDGTKPLPPPMLIVDLSSSRSCGIHMNVTIIWRQFHKRYLSHQLLKLAWKLHLRLHSTLPAANDLNFAFRIFSHLSKAYFEVDLTICTFHSRIITRMISTMSTLIPARFATTFVQRTPSSSRLTGPTLRWYCPPPRKRARNWRRDTQCSTLMGRWLNWR